MSDQPRITIAIAQINLLVGDVDGNRKTVVEAANRARDELSADVVVFPELTLTGYPPEDLLLRPGLQRAVDRALQQLLDEIHGIHVVVGFPRRTETGLFNAAGMIHDGRLLGVCHKHQLPNYLVFDEKRYFTPGANEPCVVEVKGVPLGITICEDIWFPDAARAARERGARILLNVNASPYHVGKGTEREDEVRKRVHETGLPVVYTNLVGGQDELVFDGESFVLDGEGRVVARAPAFTEGLFPVHFEADGDSWKISADITPPMDDVASSYNALVLGVKDYVRKNGFQGAVLGLSGGVDSALTLAVAVDALGAGAVEAVMMPSRYTADMSLEDARAEAEALGVNYRVIPIEKPFAAFLDVLADEFAGTAVDTTEENIQARCRGVILMAISNKKGRILLTTGNKSEMSVGYATLYGDMAGGFAPLKDVPKLLVYRMCEYRNGLSPVIPQRVLERPPSAELAPGQKDEDSLPPYALLDPILELYVERDMSVHEIVAHGFDEEMVRQTVRMVDRNEYKRRQAPPGARITRRAFGRDRRYPITCGYSFGKH
jgi:NAD+ synthase (glutamine-hydrolysing)